MRPTIREVILLAEAELRKPDAYPYLPGIIETLKLITKTKDETKIHQLLGGLIKVMTDDNKFYQSNLGQKIAKAIEVYYEDKYGHNIPNPH